MANTSKFKKALNNQDIPYLIGETAYIHEGDSKYLLKLVGEMIKKECCDAIKFHIMIDVDSYITPSHNLYGLYKKMKLSEDQWLEVLKKVKSNNLETIVLVDDKNAIDFVKKKKDVVDAVELHAIALNNIEMLDKIKDIDQPIILGIGGSTPDDIEFALDYLDRKDVLFMHGFQNYPTKYEYINFRRMNKIKEKFNLPIGYADHTEWSSQHNELFTLAGFMAGANILEKHVALKAGEKRIDFEAAVSIKTLCSIKKKMNLLNKAKGNGSFEISDYENIYAQNGPMKFTIVAARDLDIDQIIKKQDITFRRTGEENSIKQREYFDLLGKKVKKDIPKLGLINWENVEK